MAITYKIDVLAALKAAGWSAYRINREKLLPGSTVQRLRNGETISMESIDKICEVLGLQPGDLLRHE